MSEKRKDSKGRILRTGESERKDGLYQYRYKDINGSRRTIYANDLKDLRSKEAEVEKLLLQGLSFFESNTLFSEVLDSLFNIKHKWKDSTRETMVRYLSIIKKSKIYNMPIGKIKMLDCKTYLVELQKDGYSFGSIASIHALLKMAFSLACDDDVINKNPCGFKLKSVINDDTPKVIALSSEQESELISFLKHDTYGRRRADMVIILLGTGMRIGEFAALTIKDIDLEKNVIHINKQIHRLVGRVVITNTKSKNGIRDIPMTRAVRASAMNLIKERRKCKSDTMIDGHVGFLSVTANGRPRTGPEYADSLRLLIDRYNKSAKHKIDRCTPHVFRHTFCTKCIASGMDIKTVQYLMGHSDASTTLNVYADTVHNKVVDSITLLDEHLA